VADLGLPIGAAAVVHQSPPAAPDERGRDFGAARSDAIDCTLSFYGRLFAATRGLKREQVARCGAQIRARVDRDWPQLAAEIEGIAAGAGVDRDQLFAANARTEMLAGQLRGECSTIASIRSARPVLMQNWDWHPDVAPARVIWVVEQAAGGWFATLTEAGLLAKIGLNSRGLAACLNLLSTSVDGGLDALPVHLALRLMLETCASVGDARKLLSAAPFGASSCITVMDSDGDVAMFECRPGGPPLEPRLGSGWASHTNHFLSSLPNAVTDTLRRDWPDTEMRLASIQAALGAPAADIDVPHTLRNHDDAPISICCHDESNPSWVERQATLASIRMSPPDRELQVAWGQPCARDYERIPLPAW
jgi:isopenicillin-N N-acyltransferase like protein